MLVERLWGSLGASLTALGASLGALGWVLGALRELLGTFSAQETFYFQKNELPAPMGARFSKPVRARTGSDLLRERMLSRRIEKRAATDSEQMRQETIGIIKRSVIKLFLYERAGAQ